MKNLFCDLIHTVIIITIFREISLNLKVYCNTVLITDRFYFCIFNGRKGICYYGKSCNTGCKPTSYLFVM